MKGLGFVTPPQHGASDEGETEGSYNIPHLNVVIALTSVQSLVSQGKEWF